MSDKIYSLTELSILLEQQREKKIVHCHGVFDLLHPGHIQHLQEAKKKGDILVVTVTADSHVNKGPGRPYFSEKHRMQSLAALKDVDYVALSPYLDASTCIEMIKPSFYVKGKEYKDLVKDPTGKIIKEISITKKQGGDISFTDGDIFSSSYLLNRFFNPPNKQVENLIRKIKKHYTADELIEKINALCSLKVLIIGDAIIDEYQYVSPLEKPGKGMNIAFNCEKNELFIGGSLIIANHVAEFTDNVTLLTIMGSDCVHNPLIQKKLNPKIFPKFYPSKRKNTLTKKRYVYKEDRHLTKLFETYSHNEKLLDDTEQIADFIEKESKDYDLILVADFGNGFIDAKIRKSLEKTPNFLTINTQVNSGNRGRHILTKYKRTNFFCLNETELNYAIKSTEADIEGSLKALVEEMKADAGIVTLGKKGAAAYCKKDMFHTIPALSLDSIDTIGAGDSFFSLASLCKAKKYPTDLSAFIASIAAAIEIKIIGNQKAIDKGSLCKYLIRLLK